MTTADIGGYIARMDKYLFVDDLIPDSIPDELWVSVDVIKHDGKTIYVKSQPMNIKDIETILKKHEDGKRQT